MRQWRNLFLVISNANSMVRHVVQIKTGIVKHVDVNVKITVSAKRL